MSLDFLQNLLQERRRRSAVSTSRSRTCATRTTRSRFQILL